MKKYMSKNLFILCFLVGFTFNLSSVTANERVLEEQLPLTIHSLQEMDLIENDIDFFEEISTLRAYTECPFSFPNKIDPKRIVVRLNRFIRKTLKRASTSDPCEDAIRYREAINCLEILLKNVNLALDKAIAQGNIEKITTITLIESVVLAYIQVMEISEEISLILCEPPR